MVFNIPVTEEAKVAAISEVIQPRRMQPDFATESANERVTTILSGQ